LLAGWYLPGFSDLDWLFVNAIVATIVLCGFAVSLILRD
jgi:hypothetical protein